MMERITRDELLRRARELRRTIQAGKRAAERLLESSAKAVERHLERVCPACGGPLQTRCTRRYRSDALSRERWCALCGFTHATVPRPQEGREL